MNDKTNYCDVCQCKVFLPRPFDRRIHNNGEKHQRKLNQQRSRKYGTAEYFMEQEREKSKKSKKSTLPTSQTLQTLYDFENSVHRPQDHKKKKQTQIEKYTVVVPAFINRLDTELAKCAKRILQLFPESINMLEKSKFKRALTSIENLIEILWNIFGIAIPLNENVKFAFECFYDHDTMRVYFADLSGILFDLPFKTKHQICILQREDNIDIFSKLFGMYINKVEVDKEQVCQDIEAMTRIL